MSLGGRTLAGGALPTALAQPQALSRAPSLGRFLEAWSLGLAGSSGPGAIPEAAPAVAPRPRTLEGSAACSLPCKGHCPGSSGSLPALDPAPRGLACFLAKLPQEAEQSTPFPLFPELAGTQRGMGLPKQPGLRGQLRASLAPQHLSSYNYKQGQASPPLLDPAKAPKPALLCPSCHPETFQREQPRAHRARVVAARSRHGDEAWTRG